MHSRLQSVIFSRLISLLCGYFSVSITIVWSNLSFCHYALPFQVTVIMRSARQPATCIVTINTTCTAAACVVSTTITITCVHQITVFFSAFTMITITMIRGSIRLPAACLIIITITSIQQAFITINHFNMIASTKGITNVECCRFNEDRGRMIGSLICVLLSLSGDTRKVSRAKTSNISTVGHCLTN